MMNQTEQAIKATKEAILLEQEGCTLDMRILPITTEEVLDVFEQGLQNNRLMPGWSHELESSVINTAMDLLRNTLL